MTTLDRATELAARSFIAKVSAAYDIAGAIVFGSRARRANRRDSDVDIAVLIKGRPGGFLDTKLDMADMAFDVLLDTGILIQPLPIWQEEWEHPETYSNPGLLRNIARDGIRL